MDPDRADLPSKRLPLSTATTFLLSSSSSSPRTSAKELKDLDGVDRSHVHLGREDRHVGVGKAGQLASKRADAREGSDGGGEGWKRG
jgi:hypothetical protein